MEILRRYSMIVNETTNCTRDQRKRMWTTIEHCTAFNNEQNSNVIYSKLLID